MSTKSEASHKDPPGSGAPSCRLDRVHLHRPLSDTTQAPSHVPYSARILSHRERIRLDAYHFISPKNCGRTVTVVEPCRLALALELEFDLSVASYVERPRTLVIDGCEIELCFWLARTDGAESFIAFRRQAKPTANAVRAEDAVCAKLMAAARVAGIALTIRKPPSLVTARVANATRLELLPYVQSAADLKALDVFIEAVLLHMNDYPLSSFHGIETSLSGTFDWRDVRCATCLLIHRGVLSIKFNERLSAGTRVRLEAAGT